MFFPFHSFIFILSLDVHFVLQVFEVVPEFLLLCQVDVDFVLADKHDFGQVLVDYIGEWVYFVVFLCAGLLAVLIFNCLYQILAFVVDFVDAVDEEGAVLSDGEEVASVGTGSYFHDLANVGGTEVSGISVCT